MSDLRDDFFTFDTKSAQKEAEYCKSCKTKPCMKACPLNIDVEKILKLIREYKIKEAYDILISQNSLADYTCYLCKERPICTLTCASSYNEGILNRTKGDPIDIPLIEEFLVNYVNDNGDQILLNRVKSKRQVAIIGTNACALACAFNLIFNGFNVAIYENTNIIGQELRSGISNVKLANQIVDNYEKKLIDFGTSIYKNISSKQDLDLLKIRKEYDYLVIASNLEKEEAINIKGETLCINNPLNEIMHLIMYAEDFIKLSNREDYFKYEDKVIVIGNSSLSFDSARIVNKFVKNIELTFVNDQKNSGISNEDIIKSKLKDFNIINNVKPIRINIVNGKVEVTFIKTKTIIDSQLGTYIEDIFDSEYTEICDHLIIDNTTEKLISSQILKIPGITYDKNYNIITVENGQATSDGTTFICGDLTKHTKKNLLDSIHEGIQIAQTIINESGGDIQEYKDEINNIIRKQNANMYDKNLGDDENE